MVNLKVSPILLTLHTLLRSTRPTKMSQALLEANIRNKKMIIVCLDPTIRIITISPPKMLTWTRLNNWKPNFWMNMATVSLPTTLMRIWVAQTTMMRPFSKRLRTSSLWNMIMTVGSSSSRVVLSWSIETLTYNSPNPNINIANYPTSPTNQIITTKYVKRTESGSLATHTPAIVRQNFPRTTTYSQLRNILTQPVQNLAANNLQDWDNETTIEYIHIIPKITETHNIVEIRNCNNFKLSIF